MDLRCVICDVLGTRCVRCGVRLMNSDYTPCPHCRTRPLCWEVVNRGVHRLRCMTCGYTQEAPYSRADVRRAVEDVEMAAEMIRQKTEGPPTR